jgi:hypothetical protein
MPAPRAAISAASPVRSRRSPPISKKELKPGNAIQVTGQIDSMNQAFRDMIDVPNADGELSPGIYCAVELKVPRRNMALNSSAGPLPSAANRAPFPLSAGIAKMRLTC